MATDGKPDAATYKVLISVDESPHSKHAFQWYMTHAHSKSHAVLIAHCIRLPIIFGEMTAPTYGILMADAVAEGDRVNELYSKKLKRFGIHGKYVSGRSARPEEWVADLAKSQGVSLVVAGSRGQSAITRSLMGSHSEYLLHHVHCPIAVCHMPDKKQQ